MGVVAVIMGMALLQHMWDRDDESRRTSSAP